jgi:hypothetical protein
LIFDIWRSIFDIISRKDAKTAKNVLNLASFAPLRVKVLF